MSKVLVTESHLGNIADAIRLKNGASTTYRPGDMAAAIEALDTSGIHPTGTKNITQNGTHDVTQYASANVNVQPNLQSKTVTENGTVTPDQGYDGLSSVVVNVSGGSGDGLIPMDAAALNIRNGYVASGTWYYYPPTEGSRYSDVYAVESGKTYFFQIGQNTSNRFRAMFSTANPANTTSDISGISIVSNDSPSPYTGYVYIAPSNGFITITKSTWGDGTLINTYMFDTSTIE